MLQLIQQQVKKSVDLTLLPRDLHTNLLNYINDLVIYN